METSSAEDLLPRKKFTFQTLKSCPCQSIFSFCTIPEKEPQNVVIIQTPLGKFLYDRGHSISY